eukprot:TRINITY_DN14_c0_g1_i3.p1 TRINITY_DN14_c0_g1~~TRINITY_DN14_c0_g1_i3.p1  ORF type:complete len:123 (-),score=20.97 TRINITY_DN14_c0_g1_i3:539-907(-)
MARTKKVKHGHATSAVVKNKASQPEVKWTDMRAASGQRMAVMKAKFGEKMAHFNASMMLAYTKVRHPVNPMKRVAAKERSKDMRQAATERRKQQIALAENTASGKRARVREKRAANMDRVLH